MVVPLRPLLALVLLTAACQQPAPPEAPARVDAPRLGVMAPAAVELMVALGLTERIVGVGDFVPTGSGLANVPRLGSYEAPSLERIVELRVSHLVSVESQASARSHGELERLGVQVVALDTASYDGMLAGIARLGALFGRESEARALHRRIDDGMRAIEGSLAGTQRVKVLLVVGREPLYVAGPGSFVDTMIRTAGGENVAADADASYAMLSLETALLRAPEVIIDISDNAPSALRGKALGDWREYSFVPAVRNERVYFVDPQVLAVPGPRLVEMTRLIAKMLHPEKFGEPRAAELSRGGAL